MPAEASGFDPKRLVEVMIANIEKVLKEAEVETETGMKDVGIEVVNAVKRTLSAGGSGRTYRRGNVVHRASAPGQPPAVDTGKLRSSYTYKTGRDPDGPFVEVGTSVKYAPFLEFGTRRMAPRPHLRPSVESIIIRIPELISEAWTNGLKVSIGRLPTEIEV